MRVFALGGYGKVGLPAIKLLSQCDLVSEIGIAGRNFNLAEKAAKEIGKKAIAVRADGTSDQDLVSLLSGYDVIMNAAFDETVLPTIRAAIRTGTHYCDANVVDKQALQLAPEAASAGIIAVIASGISPCISNLMGIHVADQLDKVEQLQLGRADIVNFKTTQELTPRQWLMNPEESLIVLSEFRGFIGWMLRRLQDDGIRRLSVYNNGLWVEIDPLRNSIEAPLAQGGSISAYPFVSGDPLWGSLSPNLSRLPPVEVWFSPFPPQLHDLLRDHASQVLNGITDSETAIKSFYETIKNNPHRWLTLHEDFVPVPKMWVRAVGFHEGRAARYSCWFTDRMWNVGGWFLTSAALAAAALIILRGEIQEPGIMTAETAFEPLSFFDEVASLLPEFSPDDKMIGGSFEWLE